MLTAPEPTSTLPIWLPVLAITSSLVCIPPLVTHVNSRNLAATVLTFWIVLGNLFNSINPLLWPTNDITGWWDGVGLCDVEIKLQLAAGIACIGALVCIYRRLALILDVDRQVVTPNPADRQRRLIIECTLCFGLPTYIMIAHYIVQPSRYYVYTVTGCFPSFDNSWPTIVLIFLPPVILCLVAAVYCFIVIYRLVRLRHQFSSILGASQSKITGSQFIRLFAMATALIFCFLPLSLYIFFINLEFPRHAYSWQGVHTSSFSNQIIFVTSQGGDQSQSDGYVDRGIQVASGYVIFGLFGFSREATAAYRRWLQSLGSSWLLAKLCACFRMKPLPQRTGFRNKPVVPQVETMNSETSLRFEKRTSIMLPSHQNTLVSPARHITAAAPLRPDRTLFGQCSSPV